MKLIRYTFCLLFLSFYASDNNASQADQVVNEDRDPCSICYEEDLADPVELNCEHRFCKECILGWFKQKFEEGHVLNCPYCQQNTTTIDGQPVNPEELFPILPREIEFEKEFGGYRVVIAEELRPEVQRVLQSLSIEEQRDLVHFTKNALGITALAWFFSVNPNFLKNQWDIEEIQRRILVNQNAGTTAVGSIREKQGNMIELSLSIPQRVHISKSIINPRRNVWLEAAWNYLFGNN